MREDPKSAARDIDRALASSREFGEMAGTSLNEKKLKALATDKSTEKETEKVLMAFGSMVKCSGAFVVVGGVVSNGREDRKSTQERACLQNKRMESYRADLEKLIRIPLGFEEKAKVASMFSTPKMVYGTEVQQFKDMDLRRGAGSLHKVCWRGKCRWRSREMAFTLLVKRAPGGSSSSSDLPYLSRG